MHAYLFHPAYKYLRRSIAYKERILSGGELITNNNAKRGRIPRRMLQPEWTRPLTSQFIHKFVVSPPYPYPHSIPSPDLTPPDRWPHTAPSLASAFDLEPLLTYEMCSQRGNFPAFSGFHTLPGARARFEYDFRRVEECFGAFLLRKILNDGRRWIFMNETE